MAATAVSTVPCAVISTIVMSGSSCSAARAGRGHPCAASPDRSGRSSAGWRAASRAHPGRRSPPRPTNPQPRSSCCSPIRWAASSSTTEDAVGFDARRSGAVSSVEPIHDISIAIHCVRDVRLLDNRAGSPTAAQSRLRPTWPDHVGDRKAVWPARRSVSVSRLERRERREPAEHADDEEQPRVGETCSATRR